MPNKIERAKKLREAYTNIYSTCKSFEQTLKDIMSALLSKHRILSIEARTKEIPSFVAKANRPGKNYKRPLTEITDIIGLRIVVEYKDEAESIENDLRAQLIVDEKNSKDTREAALDSEFGYSAIHIVANFPNNIIEQHFCQAIKDIKFEIQIRTNLENAWATKARHLFYGKEIPTEYKRAFNRLSALLELADEQFLELKNSISNGIIPIVRHDNEQNTLTIRDVLEIIQNTKNTSEIENILSASGLSLSDSMRNEYAAQIADVLIRQGARSKEDAEKYIKKYSKDIAKASELYMQATDMTSYPKDSLLHASLAIVGNGGITAADYCSSWTERWKNGFITAAERYAHWKKR